MTTELEISMFVTLKKFKHNIAFFYKVFTPRNIYLLGSIAGFSVNFLQHAFLQKRQGRAGVFEAGLMAGVFVTILY